MNLHLEFKQEFNGRWLAEAPQLPGVLAYGSSGEVAMTKAEALAFHVLAERIEQGESRPLAITFSLEGVARSHGALEDDR